MTDETADGKGNKPIAHEHDGAVHAAVWNNHGANGDFLTATFERRYRDNAGQWQSSQNYSADDLLHLEKLVASTRQRMKELARDKTWASLVEHGHQKASETGAKPDDVSQAIAEHRRSNRSPRRS
jgi:hypothetical protein